MNAEKLQLLADSIALRVIQQADRRWENHGDTCSVAVVKQCKQAIRNCLREDVYDPEKYITTTAWNAAKKFYSNCRPSFLTFIDLQTLEIQDGHAARLDEKRKAYEEIEHIMATASPRDRPVLEALKREGRNTAAALAMGLSIDQLKRRKQSIRKRLQYAQGLHR